MVLKATEWREGGFFPTLTRHHGLFVTSRIMMPWVDSSSAPAGLYVKLLTPFKDSVKAVYKMWRTIGLSLQSCYEH